jgi:nicotinamidase-related amidase
VLVSAALLVMDFQTGIVARLGSDEVVSAAGTAIAAAREHGVPVVFVRVAFREGYPEASARNLSFSAIAERGGMTLDDPATRVVDALEPRTGEVTVVKRRVSAFTGSDLEVVLRAAEVDHLVLSGIATSGVVLSTLREAADRDFRLSVLADACADGDDEVHRVLTEKVFPRQAEVTTVADWVAGLA